MKGHRVSLWKLLCLPKPEFTKAVVQVTMHTVSAVASAINASASEINQIDLLSWEDLGMMRLFTIEIKLPRDAGIGNYLFKNEAEASHTFFFFKQRTSTFLFIGCLNYLKPSKGGIKCFRHHGDVGNQFGGTWLLHQRHIFSQPLEKCAYLLSLSIPWKYFFFFTTGAQLNIDLWFPRNLLSAFGSALWNISLWHRVHFYFGLLRFLGSGACAGPTACGRWACQFKFSELNRKTKMKREFSDLERLSNP